MKHYLEIGIELIAFLREYCRVSCDIETFTRRNQISLNPRYLTKKTNIINLYLSATFINENISVRNYGLLGKHLLKVLIISYV